MKPRSKIEAHYLSFRAQMEAHKSVADKLADFFTSSFGTITFLIFNVTVFVLWILVNEAVFSIVPVFDPFPYGLLTTAVSLEAIFLSIVVLISQNRASAIADFREELDLAVNTQAEREITRLINMVDDIHDHLGLSGEDDAELAQMKGDTDIEAMKADLRRELLEG